MTNTIRLYDIDSHCMEFTATVLSCTPGPTDGTYHICLDRTAFFPEGGGQAADRGTLQGLPVLDVQNVTTKDGTSCVIHTVTAPLPIGSGVEGRVDAEIRLRRMQCHTAEHILSGLIHKQYGLDNVGFHLNDREVTLDFNGTLTRADLDTIEDQANRIIRACLPVRASYPSPEVLATLTYRAKLELTEHVRIVTIGEEDNPIDRCACCAPHVSNTGEIGLVKMLDFARYKGGVRIHMLAGSLALMDYRLRYTDVAALASDMSVKQVDVQKGYLRLKAELEEKRALITALRREIQDLKIAALVPTEGSLCLFEPDLDMLQMRQLFRRAVQACGLLCGIFSGDDIQGYRYIIGRGQTSLDMQALAPTIQAALSAKGGVTPECLQGKSTATRADIEAFFASFTA